MTALNKVIQMYSDINIDQEMNDWIDATGASWNLPEGAEYFQERFLRAFNDPKTKMEAAYQASLSAFKAVVTKRKQIKIKDKHGNVDFFALGTLVINVSRGVYILFKYSNVDAIDLKYAEQDKHEIDVARSKKEFRSVVDPIREYMIANDIETPGEAMLLMGHV